MRQKRCTKCGRMLPVDYFTVDRTMSDGLACWCKDCTREKSRRLHRRRKLEKESMEVIRKFYIENYTPYGGIVEAEQGKDKIYRNVE